MLMSLILLMMGISQSYIPTTLMIQSIRFIIIYFLMRLNQIVKWMFDLGQLEILTEGWEAELLL